MLFFFSLISEKIKIYLYYSELFFQICAIYLGNELTMNIERKRKDVYDSP
jgi:hypothetical protein